MNTESKPSVTLKRKNIQVLLDYCIETKQEFTVVPKGNGDEYTVEINITAINKAISFGMFLRENKMEANGVVAYVNPAKEVAIKGKSEKTIEVKSKESIKDESGTLLDLDETPAFEFDGAFGK